MSHLIFKALIAILATPLFVVGGTIAVHLSMLSLVLAPIGLMIFTMMAVATTIWLDW